MRKAYELRDKVSERERFYIDTHYFEGVTGEMEKAVEVFKVWKQTYPRDTTPYVNLDFIDSVTGKYESGIQEAREALRLDPNSAMIYGNLAGDDLNLDRLPEAEAIIKQAEERRLESEALLATRYWIAFLTIRLRWRIWLRQLRGRLAPKT